MFLFYFKDPENIFLPAFVNKPYDGRKSSQAVLESKYFENNQLFFNFFDLFCFNT